MLVVPTHEMEEAAPGLPNEVGEFLRAVFFKDHGKNDLYGGYSTLDWAETVTPLESCPVEGDDWDPPCKWTRGEMGGIECRWYWDGDGVLEFVFPNRGVLSNSDCKKSYRWEYYPKGTDPEPETVS